MKILPYWMYVSRYSSTAHLMGVGIYGRDWHDKWPWSKIEHQDRWYFPLVKGVWHTLNKLYDLERWVAYRTYEKYHVVVMDTKQTGYRYMDTDDRMFHAMFALLGQYVEIELGPVTVDMSRQEHQNEMEYQARCEQDGEPFSIGEMVEQTRFTHRNYRLHSGCDEVPIDLWIWYKHEYPKQCQNPAMWKTQEDGTRLIDEIKDEKLTQLFTLRRTLWT